MDELEKNIPNDFWRKAFDEAAETPPSGVWDAIERRLDESANPKIIPLWKTGQLASRPVKWSVGIAAAIALLLIGWWSVNTAPTTSQLAHNEPLNKSAQPQPNQTGAAESEPALSTNKLNSHQAEKLPSESVASATPSSPALNQAQNKLSKPGQPASESEQSVHRATRFSPENQITQAPQLPQSSARFESRPGASEITNRTVNPTLAATASRQRTRVMSVGFTSLTSVADINSAELVSFHTIQINKLSSQPMKLRSPGGIHRIVWYRPADLPLEPERSKLKHEHREVWASVSLMPGAFNPSVAIRSLQTAALNVATSSQPSVSSQPNFSMAYQAGAGVQLSEHWSVESGIGYLSAHSTVESPSLSTTSASFAATNKSATSGNLYANAVRNSVQGEALYASPAKGNYDNLSAASATYSAYDNRNQQALANNFEYVQVPVQLGYQFRPRKRLGMAILGGFLTNIFVRNTVGDDLVVTGKDGVYRPVSLAASMGARFRYRPSHRWSASLAGMYQPSLGFGTRPESQVQTTPTSAGMSFGLDYHF
ncbi:hypothetical protein WBJ53_31975 [Spirosoma sp. SC4-14]|uniref:hypothetical protein n=1 Tax=Spirosoma sp. SC4-14 TaxID=3128900 RepID=UPI0030CEC46C